MAKMAYQAVHNMPAEGYIGKTSNLAAKGDWPRHFPLTYTWRNMNIAKVATSGPKVTSRGTFSSLENRLSPVHLVNSCARTEIRNERPFGIFLRAHRKTKWRFGNFLRARRKTKWRSISCFGARAIYYQIGS